MNIIGVNGLKRSGKGETGNAIEALALGVRQVGFADKLKIFVARSLGFQEGYTDAERIALMDEAKEHWFVAATRFKSPLVNTSCLPNVAASITGRQLLQYAGTEARKVFGEDFWVDQVLPVPVSPARQMNGLTDRHNLAYRYPGVATVAFTDLRFENEAQRIVDLGGFNVEVIRPGLESDGHDSEQKLPGHLVKYVINNNGTLEDLRWEVNKVLELEGILA